MLRYFLSILLICCLLIGCATTANNGTEQKIDTFLGRIEYIGTTDGVSAYTIHEWPEVLVQVSYTLEDNTDDFLKQVLLKSAETLNSIIVDKDGLLYIQNFMVPTGDPDQPVIVIAQAAVDSKIMIITLIMEANYYSLDRNREFTDFIEQVILNYDLL